MSTRHDPFPVNEPYHGIYAHGVAVPAGGRTVHVSGQYGVDANGKVPADFRAQCRQAIRNIEAVLQDAGMELTDIVKMNCYLVRREDMAALVEVRKELLDGVRPAITTFYVAGLVGEDWLVEIDAVATAP